jgi:hypothetical protein
LLVPRHQLLTAILSGFSSVSTARHLVAQLTDLTTALDRLACPTGTFKPDQSMAVIPGSAKEKTAATEASTSTQVASHATMIDIQVPRRQVGASESGARMAVRMDNIENEAEDAVAAMSSSNFYQPGAGEAEYTLCYNGS